MKIYPDRLILGEIISAEREAAKLMIEARSILSECKSGRRDVVTEYDRRVQELLMQRLSEAVPDACFFCEENDRRDDLAAEHVFIIDPIDGTMNFVRGFRHSCISAAYMCRGELRAAAVYNPYSDELFTALRGEGAMLNGKAICVSEDPLAESIVCCGTSPYYPELADRSFRLMCTAFLHSLDIRREGSAALDLCYAAGGRCGVYFEMCISFWDYAAGLLILQEAGGVCCTLEGGAMPLDGSRTSVVAGNRQAVREFLGLVAETP